MYYIMDTEAIREIFQQQFAEFKESLLQSQAAAPAPTPPPKPIEFKSAGNKAQFEHQEKILFAITQAKSLLRSDPDKAEELLSDAIEGINKRIKHIRIADKSESGWQAVKEYMSDEIASDSEDEKRIRKADSAAMQKRKKRDVERRAKRSRSQPFRFHPFPSNQGPSRGRGNFRQYQAREGTCFGCGHPGHIHKNCPNLAYGGPSPRAGFSGGNSKA